MATNVAQHSFDNHGTEVTKSRGMGLHNNPQFGVVFYMENGLETQESAGFLSNTMLELSAA